MSTEQYTHFRTMEIRTEHTATFVLDPPQWWAQSFDPEGRQYEVDKVTVEIIDDNDGDGARVDAKGWGFKLLANGKRDGRAQHRQVVYGSDAQMAPFIDAVQVTLKGWGYEL